MTFFDSFIETIKIMGWFVFSFVWVVVTLFSFVGIFYSHETYKIYHRLISLCSFVFLMTLFNYLFNKYYG